MGGEGGDDEATESKVILIRFGSYELKVRFDCISFGKFGITGISLLPVSKTLGILHLEFALRNRLGEGIDNCLVKFSRCCNPVPGDEIIGYITKGRGVSIHRTDCENMQELLKDENRIINVSWYNEETKGTYSVDIEVLSNDRTGLLGDVVKEITSQKINIMGVNTKTSKDRIATIDITIEVQDTDQLSNVIKAIRKVDSVYEVNRKK